MKIAHDHSSPLGSLKAAFASFRSQSSPRARIPAHLRRAVLDVIETGIRPSHVAKPLGLTSTQIGLWRRGPRLAQEKVSPAALAPPRVLDVIATSPGAALPSGLRVSYEAGRLLLEISF